LRNCAVHKNSRLTGAGKFTGRSSIFPSTSVVVQMNCQFNPIS
jgi:hypothetical protein